MVKKKKVFTVVLVLGLICALSGMSVVKVVANEKSESSDYGEHIYSYKMTSKRNGTKEMNIKFTEDELVQVQKDRENAVVYLKDMSTEIVNQNETEIVDKLDSYVGRIDNEVKLGKTLEDAIEKYSLNENDKIEMRMNISEKTYDVNEKMSVTFSDDGTMKIDVISEEDESEALGVVSDEGDDEKIITTKAAKTKKASQSAYLYDSIIGDNKLGRIATAYIKAEFTYDKKEKTCTARRLENYVKRGPMGIVGVDIYDKESEVQKPSKSKRVAYQSGMVAIGLSYKGVGIVLGEKYLKAVVSCNSDGEISKERIAR